MDEKDTRFYGWVLLENGKSRPWAKANRLQCRFK